jgi:hypothetical protein
VGRFQAYEGTYLNMEDLLIRNLPFENWLNNMGGNPMRAQLNLEAVYKTANPAVLLIILHSMQKFQLK